MNTHICQYLGCFEKFDDAHAWKSMVWTGNSLNQIRKYCEKHLSVRQKELLDKAAQKQGIISSSITL